jgi:hypothetical protein
MSHQVQPNGGTVLANYGNSKGLEIIPQSHIELLINPPPQITRSNEGKNNGWGDLSSFLKYLLFAAKEQKGNYILTAFLGASLPTCSHNNGTLDSIITPAIAGGKGWGNFDVTSTPGAIVPTEETNKIGRQGMELHGAVSRFREDRKRKPIACITPKA